MVRKLHFPWKPGLVGPKIAFSVGGGGGGAGITSSWSESCIFSYNEITTHFLVFFTHYNSNEYNRFPDLFYSFSFGK